MAQYADWIFVLARTNPQAKKQEGISFFLVDMKSPGMTVRPIQTIDGGHEVNEVFFDDVRVPLDAHRRRGEQGLGLRQVPARQRAQRDRPRRHLQGAARPGAGTGRHSRLRRGPQDRRSVLPRQARRGRGRAEGAGDDPDARHLEPARDGKPDPGLLGAEDQGLGDPAGDDRASDGGRRTLRASLRGPGGARPTSRRSAPTGRARSRRTISTTARSRSTAGRTKFSAASSPRPFWGSDHGLRTHAASSRCCATTSRA